MRADQREKCFTSALESAEYVRIGISYAFFVVFENKWEERIVAITKCDRADSRHYRLVDGFDWSLHSEWIDATILPEFGPFRKSLS
jgi:hypothetical protein